MREPPPPMMSAPMMMDRKKVMIAAVIALGLLFLMVGAMLVDLSNTVLPSTATPDQVIAQENLGRVWGPLVAHFGIFLFVLGLFAAAVYAEDLYVCVRLFLLIVVCCIRGPPLGGAWRAASFHFRPSCSRGRSLVRATARFRRSRRRWAAESH